MARAKGSNNFAGTLEILAAAPLDARTVVPTKADLTASGSFPYPYVGMSVFVTAETKRYTLIGADPTLLANWQEEGQGGGGTGGQMLTGTLLAASWSSKSQTVSVTGLTTSDVGAIGLLNTATSAQIDAARAAIITPTTISAGSVTFTCENEPEIDIPFGVLVGGGGSGGGGSLPSGGTTGQALVKHSDTDEDVEWKTLAEGQGYTVEDFAVNHFTYNDASLVDDGETKLFYSRAYANTSHIDGGVPDVDTTVERYYYIEMTKATDGLSFVQRLRVFYTKSNVSYEREYERRCTSDGTIWTYADWIESAPDLTPYYSKDDTASTDIADGDYFPFYDTSASAKKKSLWSNIVDVLKNTFQQKLTAGTNIGITNNVISATNTISLNFSTSEQRVGTWVDGKPLYQKTISFGALPNKTTKSVAHSISNLKYVVFIAASAKSTQGYMINIPNGYPGTDGACEPYIMGANICISSFSTDLSHYTESYVTLRYTKTTD